MAQKKTLQGHLEPFAETGTEGVIWSFHEDGKEGYDGLHPLQEGDLLTIFNDAARQEVLWQGRIHLEYERRRTAHPLNPSYRQQEAFGYWVHGFQEGIEPEDWARMFFEEKPATLEKAPKPEGP